jgi:hypothetical protein
MNLDRVRTSPFYWWQTYWKRRCTRGNLWRTHKWVRFHFPKKTFLWTSWRNPTITGACEDTCQIICLVLIAVTVFKVLFVSLIPKPTTGLVPISYRRALQSLLSHNMFYTVFWMYWYRLQIKWNYKKNLLLFACSHIIVTKIKQFQTMKASCECLALYVIHVYN